MVKTMCLDAGIQGDFSNHSLGASELLEQYGESNVS